MPIKKRHILLFGVIVMYCAWAVTPAHAHALLLRSNPASNAVLAEAPAQVELFFSEAVESNLSTVSVLDSNGKSVDLGDVRIDASDPTRMTVSLGSLPDGVYTVAWKAISAIDGHLTSGSFPFAVGTESSSALAGQTQKTSSQLPFSALVSKWLIFASLALLVGQASFILFVWKPALRKCHGGYHAWMSTSKSCPIWFRGKDENRPTSSIRASTLVASRSKTACSNGRWNISAATVWCWPPIRRTGTLPSPEK